MAIVIGTNAGFVTVAPVADPGAAAFTVDDESNASKFTTPNLENINVSEIGWWNGNATEEANFEVGIYDHDSDNNKPGNVVGSLNTTNAKGTDAGWKTSVVNIDLEADTIYWIAVQLDNTSTNTGCDVAIGERSSTKTSSSSLTDPWGTSAELGLFFAQYALYTGDAPTPPATTTTTKLSGSWATKQYPDEEKERIVPKLTPHQQEQKDSNAKIKFEFESGMARL